MTIHTVLHFLQHYSVVLVGIGFACVVVTAYWPGRKAAMQRHAMIPLEDDPVASDR